MLAKKTEGGTLVLIFETKKEVADFDGIIEAAGNYISQLPEEWPQEKKMLQKIIDDTK